MLEIMPRIFIKRGLIILLIILLTAIAVVQPTEKIAATSLSDLLKRQKELQRLAEENKRLAEQKQREAQDIENIIINLQSSIDNTEKDIRQTREQISLSNSIIAKLQSDIDETQSKLNDLQRKLRQAFQSLYEISRISPLETVLTSKNLTEAVSRTQYIQEMQIQTMEQIKEVEVLLKDLNQQKDNKQKQKNDLEELKASLSVQQARLEGQRIQQNRILALTQGEINRHESILKKLEAEREVLDRQIYEERRRLAGREQIIYGANDSYPWPNDPNPYSVDPWLFYKRQCTSFAAFMFLRHYGRVFYNTRPGQGSAWNWGALARDQGYQVSDTPSVNSVVFWGRSQIMPYGHTAWVTRVHPNGLIDLEEYNWNFERSFNVRLNVNPSQWGYAQYIKP